MAIPIVLSPQTAYATKVNIAYPGTAAQATAAETAADTRIEDSIPGEVVKIEVGAGAITVAK